MREYLATPAQAAALARNARLTRPAGGNLQVSISFGEPVPPETVRTAWQSVMRRHGILRSGFSLSGDGSLRIREVDSAEPFWKSIDWQSDAAESIPDKWSTLLASDSDAPLDFAVPPALRFHEIGLPGGSFHYLLTAPDFLLDERSVAAILADWLMAIEGKPLTPAELTAESSTETSSAWKDFLAEAEGPLFLNPRQFPASSGEASELIGRDETAAFKGFCESHGWAPATVLHALWALALRRFGASGNVSFGIEDLSGESAGAGYSESLLPLPISWNGSLTEWLKDFDAKSQRAKKNAAFDPQPALSSIGIGSNTLANRAIFAWRGPEVNDVIHTRLPRWINFDARIHLSQPEGFYLEARDGFRLQLKVAGPAWGKAAAQDFLAHLLRLMSDLPTFADKPIRNVPVLDADEVRSLRRLTRGPEGPERPASLVAAFRSLAAEKPDQTAVIDGDYRLSYSELDALSDKLASHLAHSGLAGGWHVGLFLSQSSWIPIAIFGVLKAGNSIIPLDPSAPPEWIESTLAAHDAGFVMCDAASAPLLDTSNRRRIVLDQEWESLEIGDLPTPDLNHETPAAVLPGCSDGEPPAVRALTHGLLLSAFSSGSRQLRFEAGNSFLAHSAAGGGAFLDEWMLPLLSGGTVCVADDGLVDPSTADVTHVRMTAVEWSNQAARSLRGEPLASPSLRVVAIEAGNPNVKIAEVWNAAFPGAQIIFYSPAGLCGLGLGGVAEASSPFLSVGGPLDDIEAFVCDPDGHEILPGFAGALFLKFPGWKKLVENSSRRGFPTGLLAWRGSGGSLVIESASSRAPGVPDFSQRSQAIPLLNAALDVHIGEHSWTLAGPPSPFRVEEWPIKHSGWIDDSALPRPAKPVASDPAVQSSPTPRVVVAWKPVTVFQETGPGSRLVFIHSASGDPDIFRDLASVVGATRRVIAVRARGFNNPDACHPSVESAAAAYIDAVLEDDPAGPFVLSAFGTGTAIALEMARQLRAAGRDVPKLVLIGGIAPEPDNSGGWISSVKSAWKRLADAGEIEPRKPVGETSEKHEATWRRYRFSPLPLEVDLIVPSNFTKEAIASWHAILPDAHVESVKCAWTDMLSFPAVKRLASLLDERH